MRARYNKPYHNGCFGNCYIEYGGTNISRVKHTKDHFFSINSHNIILFLYSFVDISSF